MKPWRQVVLIAMAAAIAASCQKKGDRPVWNGPFGLKEGILFETYIEDYDLTDKTPGKMRYETQEVPKPDDRFMHYELAFDRDAGLCKIVAHGRAVNVSPDGHQLVDNYKEINGTLIKRYGPQIADYDYVDPDSKLTDPGQWMASLLRQHRVLGGYWTDSKRIRGTQGAVLHLPDNLDNVIIVARAFTEKTGAVDVTYQFKNYGQCLLSASMANIDLQ